MAATNQTSNYGLPQWLGSDKLERTDMNTAMAEIDDNLNLVQEKQVFKGVLLKLTTNQSVADNVFTDISFGNTEYDTNSFWNPANPTRITIPSGVSKVRLSCLIHFTVAIHDLAFSANKNGDSFTGVFNHRFIISNPDVGTDIARHTAISAVVPCTEGDYFSLSIRQRAGSSASLNGSIVWFALEVVE